MLKRYKVDYDACWAATISPPYFFRVEREEGGVFGYIGFDDNKQQWVADFPVSALHYTASELEEMAVQVRDVSVVYAMGNLQAELDKSTDGL